MSRIDIVKSLLRSTARSATTGLMRTPLASAMHRLISEAALGQVTIGNEQLTKAVGRIAHISAATVATTEGSIRVHVHCDDDSQLSMSFRLVGLAFAPGGAKELAFSVEPDSAALSPHAVNVLGAIACEIARALWRPLLARAPRSDDAAIVSREHDRLVVDLRSVPDVRWALKRPLSLVVLEAIKPRAIEVRAAGLTLTIKSPLDSGLGRT